MHWNKKMDIVRNNSVYLPLSENDQEYYMLNLKIIKSL